MSSSLGSLVVELSANMAQFQSDMGKAAHIAQENMEKVNEAAEMAKKGLELLGIGLGLNEFREMIQGSLEAADNLSKLSQKVGISTESLSALKYSAGLSDLSLEQLSGGLTKLSKNMLSVEQGTGNAVQAIDGLGVKAKGGAAAAFDLLNINIEASKGHLKSSEQVINEVADKFASMQDGTVKTALAMQIFGKTGADLIPLLNGGSAALKEQADEAKRLGLIISTETGKAAEDFNDNMTRLKARVEGAKLSMATQLMPSLTDIANAFISLNNEAGSTPGLFTVIGTGARYLSLAVGSAWLALQDMGDGIGALAAQGNALLHGELSTAKEIGRERDAQAARNEKAFQQFQKNILSPAPSAESKSGGSGSADTADQQRQACMLSGGVWQNGKCGARAQKSTTDDPSKALLANSLKLDEAAISQQADILASRNKMIDQYNSDNLISIKDYYAAKKAAQDENISATLALYDKEIAAIKAQADKSKKATDKAEATGKINDLLSKKAKLEQSASEAAIYSGMQESKAMKTLADQLGTVNAQVLELTGHLHQAAVIRFDQQNQSLKDRFSAEGNANALAQLETLKKYSIAQADLNKINEDATLIKNAAANAEERINLSQKAGALSELGTLSALSKVRTDEAAQLEDLYNQFKKIADASGNPKLIQDADNMKVALERLKAEANLVAQKFETIFTSSFSSAFAGFIDGTKSASDAFKQFGASVAAEISKMAAEQLATKLFGGLMSGGKGGSDSSWLGSAMSAIAGLFKADGGNVNNSSPYIVGEAGPELFVPGASGTIIPNHALTTAQNNASGNAGHTYITVHVNGSNNAPDVRRSAGQGAREALAALNGAQRFA